VVPTGIEFNCVQGKITCNAPLGSYCVSTNGQFSSIQSCPTDKFCAGGVAQPASCPNGRILTFVPSAPNTCELCGAGQTRVDPDVSCSPCPAGLYSNALRICVPCNRATTAPGTFCDTGSSLASTIAGIVCPEGSYCRGASSLPVSCPAGRECPSGSSNPTICPSGTYAPAGAKDCTTCPAGLTSRAGSISVDSCASGCVAGQYLNSASQCVPCTGPAGTYCPALSEINSVPCLAGSSCAGGSNRPISCRRGTYSAAGASVCTLCPAGSSTAQAGTVFTNSAAETCTQCPVGRYEKDNLCFSCTVDTTSPGSYCPAGTTLTAGTAGIQCPEGSYCRGDSRNAVLCPAGSRCPAGSSAPEICPQAVRLVPPELLLGLDREVRVLVLFVLQALI
jgi:hypothetical protein